MFGPLSSPPQVLYENSFSGALPTQIGQLTQMASFMVSQGPSTDNDKHTNNIDESSYQSHGATHLFRHRALLCTINSRASKLCTLVHRLSQ